MQKFRIFIGSSSEGCKIAEELRAKLTAVADASIWTGIFHLGDTSIESLFAELRKATHAVLIATADDFSKVRGKHYSTPRDNVIFELGLFMGRLGRKRTYLIAEKSLKLPSDLAGLTIAHFEINRVANSFNAEKAIAELIAAIEYGAVDEDANLIDSFLRIIGKDRVGLRTTYEQILRLRYGDISAEISSLKRSKDWHRLLAAKSLLREYLEHSGAYHEAIRFGEYYSEALHNLDRLFEEAWSRVKDIGYMNILAGRHSDGRRVIQAVVLERRAWEVGVSTDEVNELLVYAYRYLAISYHRDMVSGDIIKASQQLRFASEHVAKIPAGTRMRALLDARVDRNRAHLLVSGGKCDEALAAYENCLVAFDQLDEAEHVAGTRIAMVKAIIRQGTPDPNRALCLLALADRTLESLGALEGIAQASLLRAQINASCARAETDPAKRIMFITEAEVASSRAKTVFQSITTRQYGNDLDVIEGELFRLRQDCLV